MDINIKTWLLDIQQSIEEIVEFVEVLFVITESVIVEVAIILLVVVEFDES